MNTITLQQTLPQVFAGRDAIISDVWHQSLEFAKGEKVLIPINMRDGSVIAIGKGNPEWNYSAPHGAGRLMSRSKAKETLTMEAFKSSMEGIYTTCVGSGTIDESPMAYRSIDDIVDVITPTVEIVDIATPVYNFKASKHSVDPNEGED